MNVRCLVGAERGTPVTGPCDAFGTAEKPAVCSARGSRRTPAETDVVVLAVPLGGASVGYEVARVPGVPPGRDDWHLRYGAKRSLPSRYRAKPTASSPPRSRPYPRAKRSASSIRRSARRSRTPTPNASSAPSAPSASIGARSATSATSIASCATTSSTTTTSGATVAAAFKHPTRHHDRQPGALEGRTPHASFLRRYVCFGDPGATNGMRRL